MQEGDAAERTGEDLLRAMLRIRRFEEATALGVKRAEIVGGVHLAIGQEAGIAGACLALEPQDVVTGSHRAHGHLIARGVDAEAVMAELMGKATGLCGGKGGSMHLFAMTHNILGASGIVGGSMPLAAGAALAAKQLERDAIGAAFFGDGAANQGVCHETMNLAVVWRLPMLFVCENNQYALTTPSAETIAGGSIAARAAAYGMAGTVVDGQDAFAVFEAVRAAVATIRKDSMPALIEINTYRFHEHAELGRVELGYRPADEMAAWRARDPIEIHRQALLGNGWTEDRLVAIEGQVAEEIGAAVSAARAAPFAGSETAYHDVFSPALQADSRASHHG